MADAATFAFRAPGEGFNAAKVPGVYLDALVEMTGETSYPAGGYTFNVSKIPGGQYELIESVEVVNNWVSSTPTVFIAVFRKGSSKVMAAAQAVAGAATALVDVTAGTDLSAFTCTLRVRFR